MNATRPPSHKASLPERYEWALSRAGIAAADVAGALLVRDDRGEVAYWLLTTRLGGRLTLTPHGEQSITSRRD